MVVLTTDPARPSPEVIKKAVEVLKNGGIVAAPTETVYGLFADAKNDEACKKIFKAKGRPVDNPLIVHVDSIEMAKALAEIPPRVEEVLDKVWPGPVTIVVKSKSVVSPFVTAGLPTVAIRSPAHPVTLAMIRAFGGPLAGPSANKAGRPSPTEASHVVEDLGKEVDLVIDAGPVFFGVESTIIDVTRDPPILLRPGPFTVEELEKYFGKVVVSPTARGVAGAETAIAPGMKYRHYSPDTPLFLIYFDLEEAVRYLKRHGLKVAVLCAVGVCASGDYVIDMGSDLYEVAKNLYKSLRELDKLNVDVGVVPALEERGVGLALMNRLRKASGHREVFNTSDFTKYGLGL
ncbi:MAG: L-threonylcarbamoyladenylate synthase [Pyrobaculum sp.]